MKYYIIAGEASGDLHAANLIKEIKQLDADADFRCWGGDLMQQQGTTLVKHYRELAFMGFVEVLANLRTIFKNIDFCKEDISNYKPDVLILVDYPGFNMRIADFAHQAGLKVFYYISPQVWAWKQSRVKKLKATVDQMFVILPFEQDFYAKFNYPVDFVGHPLLDAIENNAIEIQPISERPIIAIVPGSRKQEISRMLPVMLSVQSQFPDYDFVIAGAPSISEEYYSQFLSPGTKIVYNQTYNLLRQAKAALVTSGTATLETALFEVPEVVCYSGNTLSYYIARQLIKVKFISLVNLIMDREIVKELIQAEFNTENLGTELRKLLSGGERRETLLQDYKDLKQRLGGAGASRKTAQLMLNYMQESK